MSSENRQSAPVTTAPRLAIRDVGVHEYPVARRLVATAFVGEPFARGMFGDSAVARFVGLASQYEAWPWAPRPVILGADAEGHLVGVALATLPGECGLCDAFEPSHTETVTAGEPIEHEVASAAWTSSTIRADLACVHF